SGDPQQDLEYERQYHSSSFIVPEVIKTFLLKFQGHILDQNLYEIQDAYENGFTQLTESFFKTSPWPEAESIAPIIGKEGKL
ncbi:hypothetical protein LOTGIDRAFT_69442, partial [Lottia gigantea]